MRYLQEWKKQLPYYLSLPPKGSSFFANVYHPEFNVEADEASEAVNRFVSHTRAVGKGVQRLRNIFGQVRQARVGKSPYCTCVYASYSRRRYHRYVEIGAIVVLFDSIYDYG